MNKPLRKKWLTYRKVFFAIAFLYSATSIAQVQIQSFLPTVGLVQKNQLWNLVIVNGTTQPMTGRLELVLKNRKDGSEVLTATTSGFTLSVGSLQVNINKLNPVQYNYIGMEPGGLNDLLPVGSYSVCFSFVKQNGIKQNLAAQECFAFDVEPLSPPSLLQPADSSLLKMQPSQFTWTPPSPLTMIKNLNYEIVITEVREGQKSNEAVQNNIPFYSVSLKKNFLGYSASMPPFEKDKWYAWQVVAKDNSGYAAKTETWTFRVQPPDSVKKDPASTSYLVLREDDTRTGNHLLSDRNLYVQYYSFEKEHSGSIKFFTSSGQLVQEVKKTILYGDNYFSFPLGKAFSSGQTYIVEITSEDHHQYKALFSIQ